MGKNTAKQWAFNFAFAVLLIIAYKILDNFSQVKNSFKHFMGIISPLLAGILIAYLLYPPCSWIEKMYCKAKIKFISKKARILSVLSVYFLLILIIMLFIKYAIPILFINIVDLANNIPMYYNYVLESIKNVPEDSIIGNLNLEKGLIDFFNIYLVKLTDIETLGMYAKGAVGILRNVFNIIVSIISSVYILADRRNILKFLSKTTNALFEENTYKTIRKYFIKANEVFFKFIASKGLDCIINATAVTIILLVLHVKYALLFGIMSGVFNSIPFFGSAAGCIIVAIITAFTGGFSKAVTAFILLLLFHQMDANVIEPRIMKSSLKINPLLVIYGVILGGAYFGIPGMFLAVPVITVLKMIILDCLDHTVKKQIKKRGEFIDDFNR